MSLKAPNYILGVSAYYHDSAAALLADGEIVAAAQEERFTRRKFDARFPSHAIRFALNEHGIDLRAVSNVVFYDKPLLKFERLLETYIEHAPIGFRSFATAMPVWLKEKLYLKRLLRRELEALAVTPSKDLPDLKFCEHHQSHAASAYFASPFDHAAVLCMDGVGEWATTSAWLGEGNRLIPQWQINFPHSLGLLYSAFTYFAGFKVNSGEYKLMGLAPYGRPRYVSAIRDYLIDIKPDGTFRLDLRYFDYATGSRMTSRRFDELFGGPPRASEAPITEREADLAASVQAVLEDVVLALARTLHRELGTTRLCLAGGVALNCTANGRLLRDGPFRDIWIQPAAGDAGGAVGAALALWHQYFDKPKVVTGSDRMRGTFLGPRFSSSDVEGVLSRIGAKYIRLSDEELYKRLVDLLIDGAVVGWFQGRMEFGPRALGARSILADPRGAAMHATLNAKIKHRESFRPFAPAVLAEHQSEWFQLDRDSPYMLLVAQVAETKRQRCTLPSSEHSGLRAIGLPRSAIPAVTHVDYSARVQTVHRDTNPRFHGLLAAFLAATGCPVLVNTSFNVRSEPIVGQPEDAYRCFMRTDMEALAIEDYLLLKENQPPWPEGDDWSMNLDVD